MRLNTFAAEIANTTPRRTVSAQGETLPSNNPGRMKLRRESTLRGRAAGIAPAGWADAIEKCCGNTRSAASAAGRFLWLSAVNA